MHFSAPPPSLQRRAALRWLGLALAASVPGPWSAAALARAAQRSMATDPFPLGVASGPAPDGGLVLWTRLAPELATELDALSHQPLERYLDERKRLSRAESNERIEVLWELARDAAFTHIVQRGTAFALPELARSVHVELPAAALQPGREYWYRFMLGDAVSPVGRTWTLPAAGAMPASYRLALASCQHYEHGHFGAYAHMREDDPHAVLFVGDYIYEGGPSRGRFRAHPFPAARTRFDYRLRHALYRLDPDLQRMHAHCPWWVTWDDHEVSNDYAANQGERRDIDGAARRRAAYQAYYEHMPLPASVLVRGFEELRIYRQINIGALASVMLLDNRQFRDAQACQSARRAGASTVQDATCPERLHNERTVLGRAQRDWLEHRLTHSTARWNFIAQQTLLAPLRREQRGPEQFWTDGWDGYPAERERVLALLQRSGARNPVVLGGDVHANWVCDIKRNFADPKSPVLATEFCGTSITSPSNWSAKRTAQVAQLNAHVRFAENTRRGYALFEVTPHELHATLRVLDDVRQTRPAVSTLARFVVKDGEPGANRRN